MQVPNKNYKDKSGSSFFRVVFLVVIWMLIVSSFKGFWRTRRGFLRLTDVDIRLKKAEEENRYLSGKLEDVKSDSYKDRLVRDSLRMQKDDEIVVVLPEESNVISHKEVGEELKNWQKWLSLLKN